MPVDIPWFDLLPFVAFGIVVADASVAIRGDLSGFNRDLKGAEKGTQTLGQRIKSILSPRNVIAGAGLIGIGLGVQRLVGYAGDAAKAFSDLEQTTRTVDAVFGASAGVIHAWGETAATAAGLSKRVVNEAAAVMGQTLLNMGFSAEEAAGKVVTLQQRAADLALAFGKDPQDAILAITAAMRGERDTIEKFGVSIKQADVNSRVLALGLDTSTAASKKNSEAMAILDIILDQSASSSGRFADSQDDVAVKLAQNQAKIDNFMATLGEGVSIFQLEFIRMVDDTGAEIDKFSLNFGDRVQTIMRLADETGVSFDEMKQRIITDMADTGRGFEAAVDVVEVELAGMTSTAEAEFMASARAAGSGVAAMAEEIGLGGPVVATEAGKVAGLFPSEIKARDAEIKAAGRENVIQLALGILEAQNDPKTAFEVLTRLQDEEMTRAEEIAYLHGLANSAELASGLDDNRPGVGTAAGALVGLINDRLSELESDAYDWGYGVGSEFADGMGNAIPLVEGAARGVASATGRQIGIESEPEAPDSPLHGITKWGGNLVKTYADGIFGEMGLADAAGAALASVLSPKVGMGAMSPMGMAPSPTAAGGGNQIHVHMEDRIPVRSVDDVGYGLKRLGRHGKLPGFSGE